MEGTENRMTIGVNISHNASICIKEDNSVEYYEEDRFNKIKNWAPAADNFKYLSFSKIKNFKSNFVFTSYGRYDEDDLIIIDKICKKYNINNWIFDKAEHHLYHACSGFYMSPFNEAFCIVIDGGGARLVDSTMNPLFKNSHQEMDSIYFINKKKIINLYKSYSNARYSILYSNFKQKKKLKQLIILKQKNYLDEFFIKNETEYRLTNTYNPGLLFNHLCATISLNFNGFHEAGKAMGLSAYGKNHGYRDEDLAKQVQKETEKYTIDLIEKALVMSNCKNIILSGGYALNCVNNYKYTQYFKNINFFIDPCAHDGGTALGGAVWYDHYR